MTTTCLGKTCLFGLPSLSFVNIYQFVCVCPLGFDGGMRDFIFLSMRQSLFHFSDAGKFCLTHGLR